MKVLSNVQKYLLIAIIEATQSNSETPYHMCSAEDAKELVEAGLAIQNPEISDGDKIATRGTTKALTVDVEIVGEVPVEEVAKPKAKKAAIKAKTSFELEDGVPMKQTRNSSSKYPFDEMEVGQSFHVAATEKMPLPAKSLASTCSTTSRRFVKPDKELNPKTGKMEKAYTKQFKARTVGEEDPKGPGARVFRVI